jgi:hypothetical protein
MSDPVRCPDPVPILSRTGCATLILTLSAVPSLRDSDWISQQRVTGHHHRRSNPGGELAAAGRRGWGDMRGRGRCRRRGFRDCGQSEPRAAEFLFAR